jgi:hypothetical protein
MCSYEHASERRYAASVVVYFAACTGSGGGEGVQEVAGPEMASANETALAGLRHSYGVC